MFSLIVLSALALQSGVFAEDDETFAVNFLNQYHYISQTRSGNHDVVTALRNFQQFAGLPVTGKFDEATIKKMKEPRCGMADKEDDGSRLKRYATLSKWRKLQLSYFVQHGRDLDRGTQDRVFAKALKYWADVSGLSFTKASSASSADLKISFGPDTHEGTSAESTCPYPFDGPGKVLAHAFFPSDGRAHFDEDETFTDGTSSGTNLLWVATHEFGHSLGLKHSEVEDAIMYPYYTGYVANMELHSDDIEGIRSLYGSVGGGGAGAGGGEGVCEDKNKTNCRYWTQYCTYHDFVRENCKKTCKLC